MDRFYSLLNAMGMDVSVFEIESSNFDIIGNLPPEISVHILRMLDDKSLTAAMQVNKRWSDICRMDRVLKRRICKELRTVRINSSQTLAMLVKSRVKGISKNLAQPFAHRNNRFRVTTADPVHEDDSLQSVLPETLSQAAKNTVAKRVDAKKKSRSKKKMIVKSQSNLRI